MRFILACLFAFILILSCSGCAELQSLFEEEVPVEEEIEYTEDYYDRKFMDEVVTEEELRENIFSALTDININTELIKDFKETEDENGEKGYTFIYRENTFFVTLDEDSNIASVRVGEDGEDVYLKGYEPYDVEDYIITDSMVKGLKNMVVNMVELYLDYPEVYELADDWTYKHEDCFYYFNGTVIVGEEKEEHLFDLVFYYEEAENTMHFYSVTIDGDVKKQEHVFEEPQIPERQQINGD